MKIQNKIIKSLILKLNFLKAHKFFIIKFLLESKELGNPKHII